MTVLAAPRAAAQQFSLFPSGQSPRSASSSDAAGHAGFRLAGLERSSPWDDEGPPAFRLGMGDSEEPDQDPAAASGPAAAPPVRRCVLLDCVTLTGERPRPDRLFTKPVIIWTSAAELIGIINGAQGPIKYGTQAFHFTDEGFFQTWTYGGGLDKASHFTISANVAGLLYDAYSLHGLSPDQSFWLSLGATVMAGALVEVGDGFSPYGFSAQDLTADAIGSLAGALVRRHHLEDLISFSLGLVPTTIPARYTSGIVDYDPSLGAGYSEEMYTVNLQFSGLARRVDVRPGIARFFQFSFAFLTKGYGYDPPLPSRYQEVGLEIGLNFPEILRAVGVDDTTWWGDTLLRAFSFLRIPFTQIGAYYNLTNQKWYGPGAPYHYY
ncbi:MAG TPA: DUF2279 domain-containing protein [Thermoanaerobaculia bacterium]|nr:DUF2279 domain-containing protein [Thermoanaerobaculia bacterium]